VLGCKSVLRLLFAPHRTLTRCCHTALRKELGVNHFYAMHAWQPQLNGDDDDDDDEDDNKMPCKTLIVLWHILNAGFWFET
jgi:hypothetical protein